MRHSWLIGLIIGVSSDHLLAAPAAVVTCTRVTMFISLSWAGEVLETVPCIISKSKDVNFDVNVNLVKSSNSSDAGSGSWVQNLPANETGTTYLSLDELAGDFRGVVRGAKPYIESAGYFGSLFAESLSSYRQAAINRNESVDTNLNRVRGAATSTASDIAQAKFKRDDGLPQVAAQLIKKLDENLIANSAKVSLAESTTTDMRSQLSKLPQPPPPADLASLSGRNRLPQELASSVGQAIDPLSIVGTVSLLGKNKSGQGLANAVDLEFKEYDRMDPTILASARLRQGVEALKQAKYFATRSPELARALYAQGRSARAFATGESKVDEVAVWDGTKNRFAMAPAADAVNRALPIAAFFGDQTAALRGQISNAAGGVSHRPSDSILRTTEQIVVRAEEQLDSDPVKSLGGLFRARTLMENIKLYGGAWVKLTKWAAGAAKRLREVFAPPPTIKEPGGVGKYIAIEVSKKLKDAFSTYSKSMEAGEYAVLGISNVQDIFGSDALIELKTSLRDAIEAANEEAKPLSSLDEVAPKVELWVSNDARSANENNSKSEVAELIKLRELYMNRGAVLKTYTQRLDALSALSNLYSAELSSPVWAILASQKCMNTGCGYEVIALRDQLVELGSLSQDASSQTRKAIDRYDVELKKIDQLIDAWLQVLPDPSVNGYRVFGVPLFNLRN